MHSLSRRLSLKDLTANWHRSHFCRPKSLTTRAVRKIDWSRGARERLQDTRNPKPWKSRFFRHQLTISQSSEDSLILAYGPINADICGFGAVSTIQPRCQSQANQATKPCFCHIQPTKQSEFDQLHWFKAITGSGFVKTELRSEGNPFSIRVGTTW